MKRSDVFGFSERLALGRRSERGAVRRLSLVARAVFLSLILQLYIMTGFPTIGFGAELKADFSMSPTQGPAPLYVTFEDKSTPSSS